MSKTYILLFCTVTYCGLLSPVIAWPISLPSGASRLTRLLRKSHTHILPSPSTHMPIKESKVVNVHRADLTMPVSRMNECCLDEGGIEIL